MQLVLTKSKQSYILKSIRGSTNLKYIIYDYFLWKKGAYYDEYYELFNILYNLYFVYDNRC